MLQIDRDIFLGFLFFSGNIINWGEEENLILE